VYKIGRRQWRTMAEEKTTPLLGTLRGVINTLLAVVDTILWTAFATVAIPFMPRSRFLELAKGWGRSLLWLCGIRARVAGLEHVDPSRIYLVMANHQSLFDIPFINAVMGIRIRFLAKKSLRLIPIFGWYLRQAGYFPIDRALVLSAYKMVERIIEIVKRGESVMIFPEGTRSRDGSLGEFKRGSLMAALKAGVPILPVAIDGSYNIMPRGTWLVRPTTVTLGIARPIMIRSEEEYNAKVKEVRDAIAEML